MADCIIYDASRQGNLIILSLQTRLPPPVLNSSLHMSEVAQFTQPDSSPDYFIKFLDFLDKLPDVERPRRDVLDRMNLTTGAKALDVGCGIGGATFGLSAAVGPTGLAAGIDISSALVGVASARAAGRQGIEFKIADVAAIPYPDGFFDAVRSERVFLYLPDRAKAIQEMMRVTRPGGRVVIMDTDVDCTAIHSSNPALGRKMLSLTVASMPNPYSGRELPSLMRRAGLKDVRVDLLALQTPYEFFAQAIPSSLHKAADAGQVAHAEVDEWLLDLAELNERGEFLQMWIFVLVSGTV